MSVLLFYSFEVLVVVGFLLLAVRSESIKKWLAQGVLLASLAAVLFFSGASLDGNVTVAITGGFGLTFGLTVISRLVFVLINVFGVLICLYAGKDRQEKGLYFSYLLWLIAFSNLAVVSKDFVSFIFSWGATLVLLYLFLGLGSYRNATKAFTIVGMADFSLMLGICLYVASTGTIAMPEGSAMKLTLDSPLHWLAFGSMLIGALSKAGCGPFHTWIPQSAETASMSVMAILPASLDKLLGIYLLGRMCVDYFALNQLAMSLLLVIGSLTILFAVMMALIQHDLRKLLSFHAVSQVGYMVLGFGTGTALGVVGGLFHMVNNVIYKSGLFLVGGAVGQKRNTYELEKLGGLAVYMPLTFIATIVFALSISGVPPFNGFASKWILYQAIFTGLANASSFFVSFLYVFALVAAMFGSALTLASFVKFVHAVFLGQDTHSGKKPVGEISPSMYVPLLVLAIFCIILGALPQKFLSFAVTPWLAQEVVYTGSWSSSFALIFLSLGLICGVLLWYVGPLKKSVREDVAFTGGETSDLHTTFPATEFYKTVEEIPAVNKVLRFLKLEVFDLYNVVRGFMNVAAYLLFIFVDRSIYAITNAVGYCVLGASWALRKLHTGVLDLYIAWSLIGLIALFFLLMRS
ncbi:MAG: hypothetical protein C4540_01870 [Candidatus Omnitrophota bacterium]|nr:MAG: hypothetical protein C4540_01870 [Candidatus Omnitrophota bacterium]